MKAVIMAGGLGMRLRPLTQVIPKPLLPLGGNSILEITVQRLKSCGFDDLIFTTYYKPEVFKSYFGDGSSFGVRITYSKENERLGTAGPLRLLENELKEPFLVMNGDVLTNMDFAKLGKFHMKNNADITLCTKIMEIPLQYGVVKSREGSIVTSITEKPSVEYEINAGIYFLNPSVLDHIPKDKSYNMPTLLHRLLDDGKMVLKYPIEEYWLDVGHIDDYKKAQSDIELGVLTDEMGK